MTRVWVASALVVAAVGAAVLILTADPDRPERRAGPGPPPRRVTEAQLRVYMQVFPAMDKRLRQIAGEYQDSGGKVNPSARFQEWFSAELRKHHLTETDWDSLRRQVEHVVNVIRWTRDKPERMARWEERIARQKKLVEAAGGELRKKLQAELDQLELMRDAPPIALHGDDIALAKRFWSTLDKIVPKEAQ